MIRTVHRHLLVLALFLAAAICMTWPLAARIGTHLPHRDVSYDEFVSCWALAWGSHKVLARDFNGFFDGNILYPARLTFAYSEHLLGYLPIVLPVYGLTGNIVLARNLCHLINFVLVGYFTYCLVRRLGAGDGAAVFAGLAMAFVPHRFQQWHHLSLSGFEWTPLALLCLHRLVDRPGLLRGLAAGAAVGMQTLVGLYLGAALCLVSVLFVVCVAPVTGTWRRGRFWAGLGAAVAVVALANAPLVAPYVQARRAFGPAQVRLGTVAQGSAEPRDFGRVPETNRLLPMMGLPTERRTEHVAWPGAVVGVHALIGIVVVLRRRGVRRRGLFYLVAGVVFLVLSLGPMIRVNGDTVTGPYRILMNLLPPIRGIRAPARMTVFVSLCLAVLAGWGAAAVTRRLKRRAARAAYVAVVSVLVLAEFCSVPLPTIDARIDADARDLCAWLRAQGGRPIIAHVAPRPRSLRRDLLARQEYVTYLSTFHWQRLVGGHTSFVPRGYDRIREDLDAFPMSRSVDQMQALGVTWCIVHTASPAAPSTGPRLTPAKRFGTIHVFAVKPLGGGREVSRAPGAPPLSPAQAPGLGITGHGGA